MEAYRHSNNSFCANRLVLSNLTWLSSCRVKEKINFVILSINILYSDFLT